MSVDSRFITIDIEDHNQEVLFSQQIPDTLLARVLIGWGFIPGRPNQYRFTIRNSNGEFIERL